LDRAFLLCLGGPNPIVECGLEFAQRRCDFLRLRLAIGFSLDLGLLESSGLAQHASPRRRRDRFGLAPVLGPSRAVVFLSAVLELVGVVRASGSLEYFHQPAARRVFEATNWRMVSGRIMTRVPTFT